MRSSNNPNLFRFAVFLASATLLLICAGGLVTSHGAGLAVPDWPNSYGYNMFLFPVSKWVGGIFYEHTHRLIASAIGFLTIVLAGWLWMREQRRWLRWLGVVALVLVIVQGILGGLRVTQLMDELGIFHATLAQIFFALISSIALFTSRWWGVPNNIKASICELKQLRYLLVFTIMLILVQLVLGATMRHQHAGLAIPDFPLAYGRLWPAMDPAALHAYNQQRLELSATNPVTAFSIGLQLAHRAMALILAVAIAIVARRTWRLRQAFLSKLSITLVTLLAVQIGLGAFTIWSNKSADVATAHVAVGALTFVTAVLLWLATARLGHGATATAPVPASTVPGAVPA